MTPTSRKRSAAICTECFQGQSVWQYEDGRVVAVGTEGCGSCGAKSFRIVEFESPSDVGGDDAEAT